MFKKKERGERSFISGMIGDIHAVEMEKAFGSISSDEAAKMFFNLGVTLTEEKVNIIKHITRLMDSALEKDYNEGKFTFQIRPLREMSNNVDDYSDYLKITKKKVVVKRAIFETDKNGRVKYGPDGKRILKRDDNNEPIYTYTPLGIVEKEQRIGESVIEVIDCDEDDFILDEDGNPIKVWNEKGIFQLLISYYFHELQRRLLADSTVLYLVNRGKDPFYDVIVKLYEVAKDERLKEMLYEYFSKMEGFRDAESRAKDQLMKLKDESRTLGGISGSSIVENIPAEMIKEQGARSEEMEKFVKERTRMETLVKKGTDYLKSSWKDKKKEGVQ